MKALLTMMVLLLSGISMVHAQDAATAPAAVAPAAAAPAAPVAAAPAISDEKKALILKFIDVFGTRKALEENFKMMLEEMPKDKATEAAQLKERVKIDEIIELLLPIYDRNFSVEDLKGFIAFYDSPQGHVLLEKIPLLMRDSVEVSSKYLESKFPEFKEKEAQPVVDTVPPAVNK